ncbi:MAG: DUF4397 domain-containing protein [bacterium]
MTKIRFLAVLLGAAALGACEKNAVQDITKPISGGAFVRFQNYSVSAPGVNFYANDQKVTAISATTCTPATDPRCSTTGIESTTGVVYGASANGGNYAMLAPGQYTISSRIAAATDNGLSITTTPTTLVEGKFYTYFTSGIYNPTAKTTDAFIVEDNLPTTFDYTKALIRIVNASANAPTITAGLQLQGGTEVVTVATNLAYKSASQFVTVAPGLTDIAVIIGTSATVFKGVSLLGGHVFTLAVRGDATSTSSTTGLAVTGVANR